MTHNLEKSIEKPNNCLPTYHFSQPKVQIIGEYIDRRVLQADNDLDIVTDWVFNSVPSLATFSDIYRFVHSNPSVIQAYQVTGYGSGFVSVRILVRDVPEACKDFVDTTRDIKEYLNYNAIDTGSACFFGVSGSSVLLTASFRCSSSPSLNTEKYLSPVFMTASNFFSSFT